MFWYLLFDSFDVSYLFEYTFILLYNLVFTSLPVGILGAFDQDTNAKASLAFPQLYKRGIAGLEYTRSRFWLYMFDGLYQSAVIFYIPYVAYGTGETWAGSGLDTNGWYDFGTTIATAGVICANLYVGIDTRYFTVLTLIVYIGSTLLIFIWIPIYSLLAAYPFNGEVSIIYPTFTYWALVLITVFIAIGPKWLIKSFVQSYMPKDKDIIRESWVAGDLKHQLGIRRRRDTKPKEETASLVDHLHQKLGSDDERGQYHPTSLFSPRKDISRSPLASGQSTPRSTFSYPPPSPSPGLLLASSPSPQPGATVPPPLLIRHLSDQASPVPTPTLQLSYTSPTALEAFNRTQTEIKRLSRTSVEIKRASVRLEDQNEYLRSPTAKSPYRRSSLPPSVVLDSTRDLSPVGGSFNTSQRSSRVYGSNTDENRDSMASHDFSESSHWEEEASRRRSVLGAGEGGYAV